MTVVMLLVKFIVFRPFTYYLVTVSVVRNVKTSSSSFYPTCWYLCNIINALGQHSTVTLSIYVSVTAECIYTVSQKKT